jgi:hypothetical protein
LDWTSTHRHKDFDAWAAFISPDLPLSKLLALTIEPVDVSK